MKFLFRENYERRKSVGISNLEFFTFFLKNRPISVQIVNVFQHLYSAKIKNKTVVLAYSGEIL